MTLQRFLVVLVRPLYRLIFPYRVRGKENLRKIADRPVLLCCNHISALDPVYLMAAQSRTVRFMAKGELFNSKPVARFLRGIGAFPVQRGQGDFDAIGYAQQLLEQGEILGIFPEGTRSKDGTLGHPKSGAALLAARSGALVLPACVLTKGQKVRAFCRVTVVFGQPMTTEQMELSGEKPNLRHGSRILMESIARLMEENS